MTHTTGRTQRRIRRAASVAAPIMALAMAAGATAWACTDIMGQMTLSPTSGAPGTVVSTSAVGMKGAPSKYKLLFNKAPRVAAGKGCHSAIKVLLKPVKPDVTGAWSNVVVKIPSLAPLGVSQICGLETYPNPAQTGTTHETFTVT